MNTVFQSYALFPHLDVYENVAFGLRRKKVAKDEVETRVKDAIGSSTWSGSRRASPRRCPAASSSASRSRGPS